VAANTNVSYSHSKPDMHKTDNFLLTSLPHSSSWRQRA